jgi:hypothetical protein
MDAPHTAGADGLMSVSASRRCATAPNAMFRSSRSAITLHKLEQLLNVLIALEGPRPGTVFVILFSYVVWSTALSYIDVLLR